MHQIDQTHDPQLKSWVETANDPKSDFPIQNLPLCVFRQGDQVPAIGVGIGDQILNLRKAADKGMVGDEFVESLTANTLNAFMSFDIEKRLELRHLLSSIFSSETSADRATVERAMVSQTDVTFCLPCRIGDYTDFYASVFHATNVGCMFRPDNPLLPNYKHIPIGYHGRASSVVISGTEVRRPVGQKAPAEDGGSPTRSPCALLDYELEVGFFVGQGNELGETIPIEQADNHLFGMCLLNDWSARDIQKWEYQPLGPFLAKSFASTISPWVVTMEALAPFRVPALTRPKGDPKPLDYLSDPENESHGGVDLKLEVLLTSQQMREQSLPPKHLSSGNFTNMYWTIGQILTHHASNGCNLQPGDLMGSGTISGTERESRGSLLELTWDGDSEHPLPGTQRTPIVLPTGEERKFLADGDEVIMRGYCENESHRRIGFGECRGIILPAV